MNVLTLYALGWLIAWGLFRVGDMPSFWIAISILGIGILLEGLFIFLDRTTSPQ